MGTSVKRDGNGPCLSWCPFSPVQDRMCLDNWAMLASQNPALAREVPWVHQTAGPEVGGVLLASPQMVSPHAHGRGQSALYSAAQGSPVQDSTA